MQVIYDHSSMPQVSLCTVSVLGEAAGWAESAPLRSLFSAGLRRLGEELSPETVPAAPLQPSQHTLPQL